MTLLLVLSNFLAWAGAAAATVSALDRRFGRALIGLAVCLLFCIVTTLIERDNPGLLW